ncbi:hypothetical protein MRB53_031566 [Persea americana]|uniref:Uncharacterized protein n=1 Tax=Persea americana TaxID=3435 RepID=A0ACC2KPG3_PERAE|nr:hypothetical protein MRB53_031566 [Persea americana]
MRMGRVSFLFWEVGLLVLAWLESSIATLSPAGINYEVVALMNIKYSLHDPYNVLDNWDINSVDPCGWRMVTCSTDGHVSVLGLPSQNLSGTLSVAIGNLTNLESVLLQNNAIMGPIPEGIGRLDKLQTLDLSNNKFTGIVPSSLGKLKNLNYLRLNNNGLSGPLPESLSNVKGLTLLDLSYNDLSGSLPQISARTFNIIGNPLICGHSSGNNCSTVSSDSLPYSPDPLKGQSQVGGTRGRRVAIAFGASFGSVAIIAIMVGLLLWWRRKHHRQIFFDVNDQYDPEVCLGHLKRYSLKELRAATSHFNSKNILGRGGFGIVYKGCLHDGTLVAVKRLKDYNAVGGELQFQTEVELISLAVHRNLLRLCGFCSTENERLLVYPYMPNGSVASRLRDHIHGKPALDWPRRKRIALGTARGLLYLHEQCDPKIIHQLITGQKAMDFGRAANQKGAMLDSVKKLHKENKLNLMVDKDLKNNYDSVELEEMIKVALLCTQFHPSHRPKMSDVVRMLEGEGLAERWAEAAQKVETPRSRSSTDYPQRYMDFVEESSLVVEAIELSGPR